MSKLKYFFFNLDCSAKPKTPQNPLQCLLMVELFSELQNPFLSPWNMPDLHKDTKCLPSLCFCIFLWETQHSDMLKSILLKIKATHGNCQLQIKPGSCFPHPVLFPSRAEITPDTYFGLPCVVYKQIYFILTCLMFLSRTVCWDLHG